MIQETISDFFLALATILLIGNQFRTICVLEVLFNVFQIRVRDSKWKNKNLTIELVARSETFYFSTSC